MALAYLLDPTNQYQNRGGTNNVAGYFEVFLADTDDRATVYVDFEGTLAPARIPIDLNGRCVMVVDSEPAYRVEMHDRAGNLIFTQSPVSAFGGGTGGGSGQPQMSYNVVSSDASINVTPTVVGNETTFDIGIPEDAVDALDWVKCTGDGIASGVLGIVYGDGTMAVGESGVEVKAGRYYHATAHVRATKTSVSPDYDEIGVVFFSRAGSVDTDLITAKKVVDYSLGLVQEVEVSGDFKFDTDTELCIRIEGQDVDAGSFELVDMEVHRVYSGWPSGALYAPGRNISITEPGHVLSYAPTRAWRSMHGSTWCDCGDVFGFLVDDNYYDPDGIITVVKGTNEDSEHNVTHWGEIHIAAGHAAIIMTSVTLLRKPDELQPTLNSIALWYGGNPVSIYGARHEFLYDNSQSNEVVPQVCAYIPATENGARVTLGCSAGEPWYYFKPTELWVAALD